MSLRLRLLLALAPLFILGLIVVDAGTYTSLQSYLISRVDDQLRSGHVTVEQYLERGGFGGGDGGPGGGGLSVPSGTWAEIVGGDGHVTSGPHTFTLGPPAQDAATHPVLPGSLQPGAAGVGTLSTVEGSGNVARYRVYVEVAGDGGTLVVATPLDDVDSTLRHVVLLEAGITAAVTLILVAAIWLIVRRGLRPLERIGQTARSIVATDLSRRVAPATERTEVGRLGLALNTMLSQLDEAFAERAASERRLRHFVADASHELRTPLTSMRGYAELLRRTPHMEREDVVLAIRRIEDEAERMGILVDDLLLLARLDQGRPLERRPVDLGALVVDACADARAADPARAVAATVALPLTVTGDEPRLRQALGNVLRNAIVHTPPATPVELVLRAEPGRAVIDVVDHGRGIPAEQRERVFERFHRADPERSGDQGGSGLGLSISAAILAAHGGRISVVDTPGGGATFRVELPLAAGDAPASSAAEPASAAARPRAPG